MMMMMRTSSYTTTNNMLASSQKIHPIIQQNVTTKQAYQIQQQQLLMNKKGKRGGSSSQPSLPKSYTTSVTAATTTATATSASVVPGRPSGGGSGRGLLPPTIPGGGPSSSGKSSASPTTTSRLFSFSPQRMKQRRKKSSTRNKPGGRNGRRVVLSCSLFLEQIDWHKDIAYAAHTNNWDRLLSNLKLCSSQLAAQRIETNHNMMVTNNKPKGVMAGTSGALWIQRKIMKRNNSSDIATLGLLLQDDQGRTPLHAALACRDKNTRMPMCPTSVIMYLVQLDSMACRIRNDKGRLPLHIAVLYKHSIEIISNLVETYPRAITACDIKGKNPLSYAIDMALLKNSSSNLRRNNAPNKSYWMMPPLNATQQPHHPTTHHPVSPTTTTKANNGTSSMMSPLIKSEEQHEEVLLQQGYARLAQQQQQEEEEDLQATQYLIQWQEEQTDRWATVHWLLKSVLAATSGSGSGGSNHSSRNYQHHPAQEEFDLESLSALISGGGTGAAAAGGGSNSEGVGTHNNNNATNKPLLMEALLHAAPPDLIQLLIYMSSNVLRISTNTQQQRASAIAGSTLYSCIARHYPLGVLQSLALSCPSDVKSVRDETGMGLVSAMFVSGIFVQSNTIQGCTDEWTINPQLLGCIQESIATGAVNLDYSSNNNNIAFIDWWQKIEFLICYCCNDPNLIRYYYENDHHHNQQQGYYEEEQPQQCPDVLVQLPSHYLLHCSLRNPDIPPLVLRLLCTLYYESITLPDPVDNTAFTIHLAAQTQEYIPRNYEFQIMSGETNACGILLQHCPELAYCRDSRGRLPIHIAIDSGKTYKSLEVFLMDYEEEEDSFTASDGDDDHDCMLNSSKSTLGGDHRNPLSLLEERDPVTGLYPFQQAASYSIQTAQDGYRWSCVARNKYSHAVWIGLTGRQKAILKVAEFESVSRLDTVYQLLRKRPGVIRASSSSSVGGSRENNMSKFRNECGMGLVASHFLSYCYNSPTSTSFSRDGENNNDNNDGTAAATTTAWEKHPKQYGIFYSSLNDAKESGLLLQQSRAQVEFMKWWQKMKFWIRYCEPPKSNSPICELARSFLPKKDADEQFLLHTALLNSDTPPQIFELILALYPDAAKRPLAMTLPLHLASSTISYTPRYFEQQQQQQQPSTMRLVLEAYPGAAKCRVLDDNSTLDAVGSLPLHLSIRSGKTWDEIKPLVEAEPGSLKARDPDTLLYPFMMLALSSDETLLSSAEQQLHFQYIARNRYTEHEWLRQTPRQRYHAFRQVRKEYRLERLTTVFELLRRDVSAIDKIRQKEEPVPTATATFSSTSAPKPMALSDGDTEGEIIKDDSEAPEEASDPATSETKEDSEKAAGFGQDSSMEGDDDDNSSGYSSEENNHDYLSGQMPPTRKAPKSTPSLTNFFACEEERSLQESELTREEEEEHDDILGRDVYECDASVISGLDVMSLVSGVAGNLSQRGVGSRRGAANNRQIEEEERSINITDLFGNTDNTDDGDGDDASSSDGETSQGGNSDSTEHRSNASSLRHGSSRHHGSGFMSYNDVEDDESEEESDDGLVYFQMRRKCKRDQRIGGHVMPGHMKNVRISKAPDADERKSLTRTGSTPAERGPIRKDSLRAMLMKSSHGKVIPANSDHASVHSNASSTADSYCSLKPEELGKLHSSSDMLWVSNKLHESGLLGHHSSLQNSEDDLLASYGSMRVAASSGRAKNRFDSSMDSSMSSSARLKASRSSLETSSSMDSTINSSAGPQASKSSLLSGSSIASDASTNIDLFESEASLNMSYYSGDNTNSYSTFAQGTISSMGTSSYSTFANESHAPSINSGNKNTSASPFAHGNARGADMPWGTSNNKYSKSGLGASLHDDSSNDSEPDILNDPSIHSSQRVERRGSVASATPSSDEYLEAASVHSKTSRRSSTKSKRSNNSYDNKLPAGTEPLQPLLVSSKSEEIESHGHEQGTQESSPEGELIRSLSAPILDDLTLNDDATFESNLLGSRCTADGGSKSTLDSKYTADGSKYTTDGSRYTTDGSRYTTDGESSVCQTSSVVSMSSIQSETYFDKAEMRWKKRAVAPKDEENVGTTGSSTTLRSRELYTTEARASSVPTKTLASKLLSPPESPISPSKTSRESCTPTDVGMSHVTEIRNEAITNVSTKTLANKLLSPSKSSNTKVTVSNGVHKTEMQQSEVTADRSATTMVSVPEKTLAHKLLSPPSFPEMICQSAVSIDTYASPKAEARKKMGTVVTPATSTITPANALLSSPLKRINELQQMSPYDKSSKEESLKKKLQPTSNRFGVPLFGEHHLVASSREASMRKNKAFAHAFGKSLKTGDKRSPGPKRPTKVETSPRPSSSSSSSGCPKNCRRPKHLRCRVCDTNSREVLLLPCRHLTICRHCSENNIMSENPPTCPLCKKVVKDRMLVF